MTQSARSLFGKFFLKLFQDFTTATEELTQLKSTEERKRAAKIWMVHKRYFTETLSQATYF